MFSANTIFEWLKNNKQKVLDIFEVFLLIAMMLTVWHDRLAYKNEIEKCWRQCGNCFPNFLVVNSNFSNITANFSLPT